MARKIQVRKEELRKALAELLADTKEPLYRCLCKKAKEDYEETGTLLPYDGSMSVGCGVFFTNCLDYALGFLDDILLVADRSVIDPERAAIDTRVPGYYAEAEETLLKERGKGNYTGWDVEAEVQKKDTVSYEGGSKDTYVFTKRGAVKRDRLLAEVMVIQ